MKKEVPEQHNGDFVESDPHMTMQSATEMVAQKFLPNDLLNKRLKIKLKELKRKINNH